MIQAGAGGIARDGQTARVNQHTGFHAQFSGGGFQRGFQMRGIKRRQRGKGVAEFTPSEL